MVHSFGGARAVVLFGGARAVVLALCILGAGAAPGSSGAWAQEVFTMADLQDEAPAATATAAR